MYKKDITVLAASWKGPELLKYFIPNILNSFTLNNELIIVLNEADKESINICQDYKIEFIKLNENKGTGAVDYAIPLIKGEYWMTANDDMFFHKGWDVDLINIVKENYPCSASAFLIEPRPSNNPTAFIDNIGLFNEETEKKFLENYNNGKYNGVMKKRVSYMHPMMVKTSDLLAAKGYAGNIKENNSNWINENFGCGYAMDDDFPYRLWKLYDKKFKFILSDKSCVYHAISATNNKLPAEVRNRPYAEYFARKNGMSIQSFNQEIKRNWLVEHAYEE